VPSPRKPEGGRREAGPSDYLANERTLLAWVRTAITLMALGFVVARFGLLLRELSPNGSTRNQSAPSAAPYLGVVLMLAGVLLAVIGITRFVRTRTLLRRGEADVSQVASVFGMMVIVIGAGLTLTAYLIATR